MKESDNSGVEILLAFLLIVPIALWQGFVLKVTWGWFFVPTFGLPQLGIAEALGMALVVTYLTSQYAEDKRSFMEKAFAAFAQGAIVLGMGFVYKLFI